MLTTIMLKEKMFVVPVDSCTSTECASILIESSKFEKFNWLTPVAYELTEVSSGSNMLYQGIILNLAKFYGTVVLKGNTFSRISFYFDS